MGVKTAALSILVDVWCCFSLFSLARPSRELLTTGRMWLHKVHPPRLPGWVESEGQYLKPRAAKFPLLKEEKQACMLQTCGLKIEMLNKQLFLAQDTKVKPQESVSKNRRVQIRGFVGTDPFAGISRKTHQGGTKESGSLGHPNISGPKE